MNKSGGFWKELLGFGAVAYLGGKMEQSEEERQDLLNENRALQAHIDELETNEEPEWNPYTDLLTEE